MKKIYKESVEETMTVSELIKELKKYPLDMPVMAGWEGILISFQEKYFSVENDEHLLESILEINVDEQR